MLVGYPAIMVIMIMIDDKEIFPRQFIDILNIRETDLSKIV